MAKYPKKSLMKIGQRSDTICIGTYADVVGEQGKAYLFCIGKSNMGLPIECFIPKSKCYIYNNEYIFIPVWLAKQKGIGWYLENDKETFMNCQGFELFDPSKINYNKNYNMNENSFYYGYDDDNYDDDNDHYYFDDNDHYYDDF